MGRVTCRVPIQTPMFDKYGHLTRTWVLFFEKLCCCQDEIVLPEDPELDITWSYHAYTKRDGRLYFHRLELDRSAGLVGISFTVDYVDERFGPTPYTIRSTETTFAIDADLLATPDRVNWGVSMELPQASVSRIGARLESATRETEWVYAYPAGVDSLQVGPEPDPEDPPPPVRTMGHRQYQFSARGVRPQPPGAADPYWVNAFGEMRATEPQTFFRAYAEVSGCYNRPLPPLIDVPGTVSMFEPTSFVGDGKLIYEEQDPPVEPSGSLSVAITGDAEIKARISFTNWDELIAAWNAHPLLGGYFLAEDNRPEVTLTPRKDYLGALTVTGFPAITAEGFTTGEGALDIKIGRKYTAQAQGVNLSSQSPRSYMVGPCPAASEIVIHGIPKVGSGVTEIRILAAPDGTDGPFEQVTECAPGADSASDSTAILAGEGEGEGAPGLFANRDGPIHVYVKRNGADWFELTIPVDGIRSSPVPHDVLGRLEEGTLVTADIRYDLAAPPSIDKPGRPNDVRLVFE